MKKKLSSAHRMCEARDFTKVLATRRIYGCCFHIRVLPKDAEQSRLGMIVAKRSVPRSVDRHRLKRLMREYFRCHRQELEAMDMVITALPEAAHHSNQEIRQCLSQLWHKLIKRYAPAAAAC